MKVLKVKLQWGNNITEMVKKVQKLYKGGNYYEYTS